MPTTIPGNLIFQSPTNNDPLLDLNTQPSLDLQFAASKTLDDRVSGLPLVDHQRDVSSGKSAGTYVGSDGLIKTSKVNLMGYSDYSVVAGTTDAQLEGLATAPDGTNTARRYSTPSAGLDAITKIISTGTPGADYTFSVWVRSTGTAASVNISVGDSAVSSIVSISTEWQRLSITKTNNDTNLVRGYVQMLNVGDEIEVWGAQVEEGTTASTYIPTTNLPSAAPRFDHDPVTGESLGLLVEESRTNLVLRSEEFDSIYWRKISSTSGTDPVVTPNYATAPDGTLTANRIVGTITPTGGADFSLVRKTIVTSGDHTWSIWLKSNTGSNQSIIIKYTQAAGIVTVTPEWQRFSITDTQSNFECDIGLGNEGSQVTGNSMDILAWGAQLEAGSFPTSYIPTTSSTVTRAADVASITGTNFSSWYNQSEGTAFVNFKIDNISTAFLVFELTDGINNRILVVNNSNNAQIITNSTVQYNQTTPVPQIGARIKKTLSYATNNTNLGLNGVIYSTDSSVSIPVVNQSNIGVNHVGTIARLTYYPYRLPDATLQEITS